MSNTITVFIEEDQLKAQKANNYSLYLAKKVNNSFTVIWQSKGPVATVGTPSYQYENKFDIDTPSYNVNFTNDPVTEGAVTFTSGGKDCSIDTGQITTLDANGIFSDAQNGGVASDILVQNKLQANPHEILRDSEGNNIWVNTESGMNIGDATITPKYEYQLWFENYQETGTLIAKNLSNVMNIEMKADESKTITYDNAGEWISGEPATV